MKLITMVLSSLMFTGCATVKTLNPKDDHVTIYNGSYKSYCSNIPRIYSGVSYDFCMANGEPSTGRNTGSEINGVPLVAVDAVCSAVADTLVLPYTLIRQINEGNIDVN